MSFELQFLGSGIFSRNFLSLKSYPPCDHGCHHVAQDIEVRPLVSGPHAK